MLHSFTNPVYYFLTDDDDTVYPKKYAHDFCFAVLCCGYTLTDFPISTRLTSLALWQSNDCPSAGKATLMNMDKYFMWNHYERLHNRNKAKHNKTVCIFIGIYCIMSWKHLPHYTPPLLMEPLVTHHKTTVKRSFDIFRDISPGSLLIKQSSCRWFETPLNPCGFTVNEYTCSGCLAFMTSIL